jgi:hypothetical protein
MKARWKMSGIPNWVYVAFVRLLIASPKGRAHLLRLMVAAEEGDETGTFDWLVATHPELENLVRRHQEDERRHADMFRACLSPAENTAQPMPRALLVIDCVVRAAVHAGRSEGLPPSVADIVFTYALLLAIEERGVNHFGLIEHEFRRIADIQTADTFRRIAQDERRHVRYCRAIGRRYAGDDALWERARKHCARIERRGFRAAFWAGVGYAIRHGLLWDHTRWPALTGLGPARKSHE